MLQKRPDSQHAGNEAESLDREEIRLQRIRELRARNTEDRATKEKVVEGALALPAKPAEERRSLSPDGEEAEPVSGASIPALLVRCRVIQMIQCRCRWWLELCQQCQRK